MCVRRPRGRIAPSLTCAILLALSFAASAVAAPFRLPLRTRATLPNGLTVIVLPQHRLPLVDFRLLVRAGSVNDPSGKEGLAELTTTLLTQGAGKRTARQIAEDIAFVGGELNADADVEQIVATCEVLRKDFATGLELLHDVVVRPAFPEEEFRRKKDETLGEIASERDDPATVAANALGPFLLGTNPLAHPAIGYEKSISNVTRDDVVAFHRRFVTPNNALLAVVGDVDAREVIAALTKAFADWKRSPESHVEAYGPISPPVGRQILIVNKPEVTQTQIRLAYTGVPRNSPDYFPIVVANTILGGGFTSRLVNELRVSQGLTYSVGSRFSMYRNAGIYTINTFTKNETIRKTIDAALDVTEKLIKEGPTDEELSKAKTYLTGQFPLGLQAPDELAAQLLAIEFYGLDPLYIDTYADKINAVTMSDVRRVLERYFPTENMRILVVSNPDVAKPALTGLGPIEVKAVQ
jgi:zinc protease